ncbi:hypothetical protein MVES1_000360 [Malassezia vespertilionis]|nr:uncharacterized protein MVES1_000360 [Malassezia vespertilionis]WFD05035.1 hypothetical protein MVES1_000360 [Malassezia vespertilionis]
MADDTELGAGGTDAVPGAQVCAPLQGASETAVCAAQLQASQPHAPPENHGPVQQRPLQHVPNGQHAPTHVPPPSGHGHMPHMQPDIHPSPQAPRKPKASSHAGRAKNVALSALTGGSIGVPSADAPPPGFLTAGGGARKVLPELVLPFHLPTRPKIAPATETEPLEQSIVFLQALRQTRMMHMLQVLPQFSHKQRGGMEYFDRVPHALLQGINPRKPHTLLPLGRADVRVGPVAYMGVRFWEVRTVEPQHARMVHGRSQEPPGPRMVQYPPSQPMTRPAMHTPSTHSYQGTPLPASVRPTGATPAQGAAPLMARPVQGTPAPETPSYARPPAPTIPSTSRPSPPFTPRGTDTLSAPPQPAPMPRPVPRPTPPLDAGFLARLQQRAAHDTYLQQLLQKARTGQLPDAGMAQLNAIIATLMAAPQPRERRPPVVIVEFPENPSTNFVLPLWHAAVERRRELGMRRGNQLLLSFFLPAIGSKAAGQSGHDEMEHVEGGLLRARETPESLPKPQEVKTEATPVLEQPAKRPSKRDRRRGERDATETLHDPEPPARNHELFPATWSICGELGIDERLWDAFGRVPGCITTEGSTHTYASDKDREARATLERSFALRHATMPTLYQLPTTIPRDSIPAELEEHVRDRYAMRILVSNSRPQPKRKVAALSDAGDTARAVRPSVPTQRHVFISAPAPGEPRPKRKRHVATHNPDGSIKSCGACGKTKTPMWRRGPRGPSQLCNACGAKWKAGRLFVPDVPPTPILNDTLPARRIAVPSPLGVPDALHHADPESARPELPLVTGSTLPRVPQVPPIKGTPNEPVPPP